MTALLLGVLTCAPDPVERPNLVLIIGDDHGYPYFGFMGDRIVQTPNLDRLAAEGTVFPTGYVTASTCRPSLLSLVTGLHHLQNRHVYDGVTWKERKKRIRRDTLPGRLREHGYVSFQAGKFWDWTAREAGFTEGTKVETRGRMPMRHVGGYAVFEIGRSTLQPVYEFIDRYKERPFFLWLAPMLPHTPFDAAPEHLARYESADLSPTARAYYANISRFDDMLGEFVAELEARNLRERTLIVYLSDNGWRQQPHEDWTGWPNTRGPGAKGFMNELGFRTPVIFSWPGHVRSGVVRDDLVSSLDIFPTLLDYAGATVPEYFQGMNLRPLLEGRTKLERDVLVGYMRRADLSSLEPAAPRPMGAFFARSRSWHYIWRADFEAGALYDIERDPLEEDDVSAEHPRIVRDLQQAIRDWETPLGASPNAPDYPVSMRSGRRTGGAPMTVTLVGDRAPDRQMVRSQ